MPVRLRLQRFGRTHRPFYRMVAADSRAPRDGKHLEIVRSIITHIHMPYCCMCMNRREMIQK
jgi:ribosomal protein S16